MNEVWQSTILKQLAINGNCGRQHELRVLIKVPIKTVSFQQEFLT